MLAPSGLCRPHLVTLISNTWGTDGDGGPIVTAAVPTLNVPCSVEPGAPELIVDETGRPTMVVPYVLRFYSDPGAKAKDNAQWTDPNGGRLHNLVAVGGIDRAGRGATHEWAYVERL